MEVYGSIWGWGGSTILVEGHDLITAPFFRWPSIAQRTPWAHRFVPPQGRHGAERCWPRRSIQNSTDPLMFPLGHFPKIWKSNWIIIPCLWLEKDTIKNSNHGPGSNRMVTTGLRKFVIFLHNSSLGGADLTWNGTWFWPWKYPQKWPNILR